MNKKNTSTTDKSDKTSHSPETHEKQSLRIAEGVKILQRKYEEETDPVKKDHLFNCWAEAVCL